MYCWLKKINPEHVKQGPRWHDKLWHFEIFHGSHPSLYGGFMGIYAHSSKASEIRPYSGIVLGMNHHHPSRLTICFGYFLGGFFLGGIGFFKKDSIPMTYTRWFQWILECSSQRVGKGVHFHSRFLKWVNKSSCRLTNDSNDSIWDVHVSFGCLFSSSRSTSILFSYLAFGGTRYTPPTRCGSPGTKPKGERWRWEDCHGRGIDDEKAT